MLLSRDDLEFMWNELSIYLHFILVAIFLFAALYAWQINRILAFTIGGADLLFLASAVGSVIRRNNMAEISTYVDKKFMQEMMAYLQQETCIDSIAKRLHHVIEQAYQRGYYDGKRK